MRLEVSGVDHQPVGLAALGRQACEDPVEHAKPAPADEPVVDRLVRAILGRGVSPAQAVPDDKYDPADDPAVIDPAAPSTTVALNLADVEDMRHQLDAIATDVVNYQCDVSIQVPRTQDYPWLATLLTKRVKRIDSGYDLKIHRQILKHIPAQVVLIPRKAD